jgi:hypothetical protein
MLRLRNSLLALLSVQLLLLIILWPREQADDSANLPLLSLTPDSVTQLAITDGDGQTVTLRREESRWLLAETALPARQSRIDGLLQTLVDARRGWPVATSGAALKRFRVLPEDFERRITLSTAEGEQQLYLGTAPGFRQVHARPADAESAVFVLRYNSVDIPASRDDWLEQTLLQVSAPTSIAGADYRLVRNGDTWRDEASNAPDESALQGLVRGLENLRVNRLAADEAKATLTTEAPTVKLVIGSNAGEYTLTLYKLGDAHLATRSDFPGHAFEISSFDHDRLATPNLAALFPSEADEESSGENALDPEAQEAAEVTEDAEAASSTLEQGT